MPLDEFLNKKREDLARFEKWWRESHPINPEEFPMEMGYSDWDEQFEMFVV